MRRLPVVMGLLPFLCFAAIAGTGPQRKDALERLRAAAPGRLEARFAPDHSGILTLSGPLSPSRAGAPEEIARDFLRQHGDLFDLRPDLIDLRLRGVRPSPGGRHVAFEQEHEGLPVFEAGLDLHVAGDGSIYLVHSGYVAAISASTIPNVSATQAAAVALEHFRRVYRPAGDRRGRSALGAGAASGRAEASRPQLGFFPASPAAALVYRVEVSASSPAGAAEYFVSAADASILEWRDLALTARDGRGTVFDPNPVAFLDDTSLRDSGDATDQTFSRAYLSAPLPDLRRLILDLLGPFYLSGPYAIVNDALETPFNPILLSSDGRFEFTRDQQGFEAVMVYFHVDRNQRYIQSLGFTDVNNRGVRADPHGLRGADNSHYIAFPIGWGFMAFGEGGVDDAEDADVILHEYGHAIQDNQTLGRYLRGGEAGAQGEGFGDYWAFSNSPAGGFDPPCIGEWDLEGTCLRRVDGAKRYPDDLAGEVHEDGEIWSSVLHAAFVALGKEAADRIVLESHFLVPRAPDFCEGARALRVAAATLYDEAARQAEGRAAADRGIAGDLAVSDLQVLQDGGAGRRLQLEIVNQGHCPAGPASHAIHQLGPDSGFDREVAAIETPELAPGQAAAFDLDVPGLDEPWLYRILLDTAEEEIEIDESNAWDSPLQYPGLFGVPPIIHAAEATSVTGTAVCDITEILKGHLCANDYQVDQFAAPFPAVTLTARYSEIALSALVTDPVGDPPQSDILLVAASFLVPAESGGLQEVSLLLLDDGSANEYPFAQWGAIPEHCEVEPAGVCSCDPATYAVTSNDMTAHDDLFTRGMAFVASGPDVPDGENAFSLMVNCIVRERRNSAYRADVLLDQPVSFKVEAVDRSGNFTSWPVLLPVDLEPSAVDCDGDLCGCCLLMSHDVLSDPSDGGCRGLPGLTGVPGSGFENGFCVDLMAPLGPGRPD